MSTWFIVGCIAVIVTWIVGYLDDSRIQEWMNGRSSWQDRAPNSSLSISHTPTTTNNLTPDITIWQTVSVLWSGPFVDTSSHATANRELVRHLLLFQPTVDVVAVQPTAESATILSEDYHTPLNEPQFREVRELLVQSMKAHEQADGTMDHSHEVDVEVRMQWPPNFTLPLTSKHLVIYLAFEYDVLPIEWVTQLNSDGIKQVWVPSTYCMAAAENAGVAPTKLRLVPHGVDVETLQAALQLAKENMSTIEQLISNECLTSQYRILFRGGALFRKGLDLALQAYLEQYTAEDNTCLIVHTAYGDLTANGVKELWRNIKMKAFDQDWEYVPPHVELLTEQQLSSLQSAALLAQSDVLLHPHRTEGFGLVVLEAMAAHLPVITTATGGILDFITDASAYLVNGPLTMRANQNEIALNMPIVPYVYNTHTTPHQPRWMRPDSESLRSSLHHAELSPEERTSKARVAAKIAKEHWTWQRAAAAAAQHLREIVDADG